MGGNAKHLMLKCFFCYHLMKQKHKDMHTAQVKAAMMGIPNKHIKNPLKQ